MDILAPDEKNFNHLSQVDINISPYIKNMQKILSNSIDILISDSLDRAIETHSHLPHLHFPFSLWSKFKKLEKDKILSILNNIPIENYSHLITNCVNVVAVKHFEKNDNIYNPFIISTLLSDESKDIITTKGQNYSEFQHNLLQTFVEKIPSYSKETALFAFIELSLFYHYVLPENESIFNQLNEKTLDHFLDNVLNNDYTYYIKYEMHNKFFSYKAKGVFSYLKSSHKNKIFDHFTSKVCCLEPDKINLYPILLWDEITNITNLKKEHDFLVLDNKFKHKLKTKSLKI